MKLKLWQWSGWKRRTGLALAVALAVIGVSPQRSWAQGTKGEFITPTAAVTPPITSATAAAEAAEDLAGCTKNLKIIYEAIQAYQMDHKELPNWLSDLVPTYLNDGNVLVCPACRRNGLTETSPLADPKIPSSYIYQFSPAPLGPSQYPATPAKSYREWKRRQMGMVGAVVPLVVCKHHDVNLNLAYDGHIYESKGNWEGTLTNQIDLAQLKPRSLFAEELKQAKKTNPAAASKLTYPARASETPTNLINLTPYYNVRLRFQETNGVITNAIANPSSLAAGMQEIAGTKFDVRGMIQLDGKAGKNHAFAKQVKGIRIGQKCQRLQFLVGAFSGTARDEGKKVANYTIHFATNQWQLEIPVVYGQDLRNWQTPPGDPTGGKELAAVWTGSNIVNSALGRPLHLYRMTWENVAPAVKIESIDFTSTLENPAPLLIAITAE